jgi:hypothetical protein
MVSVWSNRRKLVSSIRWLKGGFGGRPRVGDVANGRHFAIAHALSGLFFWIAVREKPPGASTRLRHKVREFYGEKISDECELL